MRTCHDGHRSPEIPGRGVVTLFPGRRHWAQLWKVYRGWTIWSRRARCRASVRNRGGGWLHGPSAGRWTLPLPVAGRTDPEGQLEAGRIVNVSVVVISIGEGQYYE